MAHTCDALIVSCIDFRFQKFIRKWLDDNFGDKTFDYVGYAGGSKELDTVMKQIDLCVKLHDIKHVVLMHHENCGAYGAESTPERHAADLLKAKKMIQKKYPHLKVDLFYILLDGKFNEVN